jgi:hypothetical protein
MIAAGLLALAIAAAHLEPSPEAAAVARPPEPSGEPPASAGVVTEPRFDRRVSAGPFVASLYGIRVTGAMARAAVGRGEPAARGASPWTDLALQVEAGLTPEGLRVVRASGVALAHVRLGPLRLGAGFGAGVIDVERATRRGGRLATFDVSVHGVLGADVATFGRASAFVEVHGAVGIPWAANDPYDAHPAFPRAAVVVGARF